MPQTQLEFLQPQVRQAFVLFVQLQIGKRSET